MHVIVALPASFAVTTPFELTVATFGLLDVHLTLLSVVFEGITVALRVADLPITSVRLLLLRLTDEGLTFLTVTVHLPVLPPSTDVHVIVTLPGLIAVTTPFAFTFAILVLLDVHFTSLTEAFEGVITGLRVSVLPSLKL